MSRLGAIIQTSSNIRSPDAVLLTGVRRGAG
jgi:hypothetical protein